jgi:hypothetical protein
MDFLDSAQATSKLVLKLPAMCSKKSAVYSRTRILQFVTHNFVLSESRLHTPNCHQTFSVCNNRLNLEREKNILCMQHDMEYSHAPLNWSSWFAVKCLSNARTSSASVLNQAADKRRELRLTDPVHSLNTFKEYNIWPVSFVQSHTSPTSTSLVRSFPSYQMMNARVVWWLCQVCFSQSAACFGHTTLWITTELLPFP